MPAPTTQQILPNKINARKGFTLVELMVVISVIAILASIGYATYSNAQVSGRDAKRKQDLISIQTALEVYNQRNGSYPNGTNSFLGQSFISSSTDAQPWIPALSSSYITSLPVDPQNISPNIYVYINIPPGGSVCPNSYLLVAPLENANDSQTLANLTASGKTPKWCNGIDVTTGLVFGNSYTLSGP